MLDIQFNQIEQYLYNKYNYLEIEFTKIISIPLSQPIIMQSQIAAIMDKLEHLQASIFSTEIQLLLTTVQQCNQQKPPNIVAYSHALMVLSKHLDKPIPPERKNILIQSARLREIDDFLKLAFNHPEDDIVFVSHNHPRWTALNSIIVYKELAPLEELQLQFENFYRLLNMGCSLAWKLQNLDMGGWKKLLIGYYTIKYGCSNQKNERRANYVRQFGDMSIIKYYYNLLNTKLMCKFLELSITRIEFNERIYMPRLSERVDGRLNTQTPQGHYTQIIQNDSTYAGSNFSLESDEQGRKIPIRVLSPFVLSKIEAQKGSKSLICCNSRQGNSLGWESESLILHIHGGGFMSMSSKSHETYTRKWANALNVPVFSIDYRLLPEYPFPAGLDDVWQVYNWIIHYSARHLGILPSNIILAGDSAGGNLALALVLKIKEKGLPPPRGIFLAYPLTDMQTQKYGNSFELSIDDKILNINCLKLMNKAYIADASEQLKDLISPINGNFEGFPRVRLLCGNKDPLYDDSIRLLEKMMLQGVDVRGIIYENAIHGLLNLGAKQLVPACSLAIEDSITMLRELLDN